MTSPVIPPGDNCSFKKRTDINATNTGSNVLMSDDVDAVVKRRPIFWKKAAENVPIKPTARKSIQFFFKSIRGFCVRLLFINIPRKIKELNKYRIAPNHVGGSSSRQTFVAKKVLPQKRGSTTRIRN
jgi:hypothetical protein